MKAGIAMSGVKYRWASLGCDVIGHQLAEAIGKPGGSLYAVGKDEIKGGSLCGEIWNFQGI